MGKEGNKSENRDIMFCGRRGYRVLRRIEGRGSILHLIEGNVEVMVAKNHEK